MGGTLNKLNFGPFEPLQGHGGPDFDAPRRAWGRCRAILGPSRSEAGSEGRDDKKVVLTFFESPPELRTERRCFSRAQNYFHLGA